MKTRSAGLPQAFAYAVRGLWRALRREANLRIELALGVLAVALAFWLGAPLVPVALAAGLVLTAELFNSAVETVVDLASPQRSDLAEAAKDIAAGGVLVASACAFLVGLAILGPPLLMRLGVLR
ncbi:MAG TPA: diacylglycerol kinase family protein [Trueperaceae bacterium]|nr:diacylglycerol kinase family protein [Trueperaceae bacterium]